LEPALNCDAALLSPSTGIIDSHAFMLALRGDAEAAGAACAFHTPLLRARAVAGRIELDAGGDAPISLECRLLVNAAGLTASAVARSIDGMPIDLIPAALFRQGQLLQLQRAGAVFASDLSGAGTRRARRAPHAGIWREQVPVRARRGMDRRQSITRSIRRGAERFYPAIRRYWPTLPDRALMPSYSGNSTERSVPPAVATQGFPDPGAAGSPRRRTESIYSA